jgi:hypothetical protein
MSKSKNFHMISPKEYVYSSMFDIYKTIVNGEVVSSLNGYSEITVDDVTYIYNRFLLCDKIQTYLLRADLLKNSLNVEFTEQFIMSEELLESFIKILNENPVSRNSFLYLANCMKGFDENVESRAIDVILDKFDLPTRLNKNRTVGEDKLVVDFSDENLLKDYLKIVTTYNLNTNFVNFNLIYKINEFFRDNFISKLDEDDYHYWHSDPVMTLAQFEEAVEAYKNTPEREHIDNFFESMFDDFEGDVDSLLGDRIWLNNRSVYTDFLVRLSNKKSN